MTYKKVGVDLDEHRRMHEYARSLIDSLARGLGVSISEKSFTRFFRLGDLELTLHVDGVGTKALVAWMTGKGFEVIGWDAVIGNANDIACNGARAIALVDYIAMAKSDAEIVRRVLEGIGRAAREIGAVLLGGETAIMPDLVTGIDVACAILGVKVYDVLDEVQIGDVVIGIASNGLHMNGYTLVRRALFGAYRPEDVVCGEELAVILLRPTANYYGLLLRLYEKGLVKAAVHITGGAFTKIKRVLKGKTGVILEPPEPPCIFREIQRVGRVDIREMYRVFNMGVGLVVFVDPDKADEAVKEIKSFNIEAWVMGKVVEDIDRRVIIKADKAEFTL